MVQEGHCLLSALRSLYRDGLEPSDHHVSRRLEETIGERWDYPKIRLVARSIPGVRVEQKSTDRQFWMRLDGETPDFVNVTSLEDIYPATLWGELRDLFENCESDWKSKGIANSRYDCALKLRNAVPSLRQYRLGDVCHIVQLAVQKHHLLGYRNGRLVPYKSSQDYEKWVAAQQKQAQSVAEVRHACWEDLQSVLPRLIHNHAGRLPLSLVKTAFRDMMHFELSETALGHTQLSCVFKDPHLRNSCSLDSQGCEPVLVPAAFHRRLPPAPPMAVQIQLAGLHQPHQPAAYAPRGAWNRGAPAHAGSWEVPDPGAWPSQEEDADKASDADSGPCFDDVLALSELRKHLDQSDGCPEGQAAPSPRDDAGAAPAEGAEQPSAEVAEDEQIDPGRVMRTLLEHP